MNLGTSTLEPPGLHTLRSAWGPLPSDGTPSGEVDLRAAQGGDPDAFARLVRRHQRWVAARLWRFTRDRAQLEELTQDVFVELWRCLDQLRDERRFRPFVHRVLVRVGLRFWRSRGEAPRALTDEDHDALASGPGGLDAAEAAEATHALLAHLPPTDRALLTLLYLEGLDLREAAALLGWTHVAARVRAHRARRKLRDLLERSPR